LAGLKVCIHVVTPITRSSALAVRIGQDRLPDQSHRQALAKLAVDGLRLLGDPTQGLLAVQALASGEKPDLIPFQRIVEMRHVSAPVGSCP
jgi:hypothetical protein